MEERKRRVYIGFHPGNETGEWIVKIENGGDDGSFNGRLAYPSFWAARGAFPDATLKESAEQWLRDNNLVRGSTQG
jgi:hypothetical protein